MQAVLLAAGFGSRLRPLTDSVPKCLVPINGRPLLDIWLQQLSDAGVSEFLINTHYLSECVEAYVRDSAFRQKVTLFHEPKLLGTLGTLKKLSKYLEGDFIAAHADNLCLCSWNKFIRAHDSRPKGCDMTMMTFESDTPETCGIVDLDFDGRVINMHEKVKNPPGRMANAAIYIMSSHLKAILGKFVEPCADISLHLIPRCYGRIFTWKSDGYLRDVGNISSYLQAQDEFRKYMETQ